MPAIWLLGSSDFSAQLAGQMGLPFSFAHHFSAANTDVALALYRQSFRASRWLAEPYAIVAVSAICAETDDEARYLAGPAGLSFLRLRQGRPSRMPTPAEAASSTCCGATCASSRASRAPSSKSARRTSSAGSSS
jgi:alkanesulfonate monooxygenase SsuD/methylene tetrahydromethanopterin reductase-like flavin-dependent oxidoreductase (luciferase family)